MWVLLAAAMIAAPCDVQVEVRAAVDDPGVPAAAQALAVRAPQLLQHVADRLEVDPCTIKPVIVDVVSTTERMPAVLTETWQLPHWAAGAATPDGRVVVMAHANVDPAWRERVLLHELTHVVVSQQTQHVPRFLTEGLARTIANESGSDDTLRLAEARLQGRLLPLSALVDGFPHNSHDAALAYAQSAAVVAQLYERGGVAAMRQLLMQLNDGAPLDDALVAVYGRRLWQLDIDLKRSIPVWRAVLTVASVSDAAMGFAAMLTAVFGVRARRRLQHRIAAMELSPWPMDVVLHRFVLR